MLDVGILSAKMEGNWEIVTDGPIGLNPRSGLTYLYFTDKAYAIGYAKGYFSDAVYNWHIRKIAEVISKGKIVR